MENQMCNNIKKLLMRLNKEQLCQLISSDSELSLQITENPMKDTKRNLISYILRNVDLDYSEDFYTFVRKRVVVLQGKYWKVSQILVSSDHNDITKAEFFMKMKKQLQKSNGPCSVHCDLYNDLYFLELTFHSKLSSRKYVYLMYCPQKNYIFHSGMFRFRKAIHNAITNVLQCDSIECLPIKVRYLNELFQFVIQIEDDKFSKSSVLSSDKKVEALRSGRKLRGKRKLEDEDEKERNFEKRTSYGNSNEHKLSNIIDEDEDMIISHDSYIETKLPVRKAPKLKEMGYDSTTYFGSCDINKVNCGYTVRGSSILEGYQKLIKLGSVNIPLPDHIVHIFNKKH